MIRSKTFVLHVVNRFTVTARRLLCEHFYTFCIRSLQALPVIIDPLIHRTALVVFFPSCKITQGVE